MRAADRVPDHRGHAPRRAPAPLQRGESERREKERREREERERGERESGERERERETPGYEPFALDVSGASLRPSNEVPSFTYRGTSLIRNCFLLGPYPSNEVPSRGENLY